MTPDDLKLLGLSRNEIRVLDAVYAGKTTPLFVATYTKVSRPTVYEILPRLHRRGLIKTTIRNTKKHWIPTHQIDLEESLYNTKKQLFSIDEGVEEVRGLSDSLVTVYRGRGGSQTIAQCYKGQQKFSITSNSGR